VSSYTPGRNIRFEFGGGRQGYHEFTLQEVDDTTCLLRHATKAKLTFNSAWRWYFRIRPLLNALIEDLFDKVESQVAKVEHPQVWSSRVQKLRRERGMSPVKNEILAAELAWALQDRNMSCGTARVHGHSDRAGAAKS
jgi:hypothetical protein